MPETDVAPAEYVQYGCGLSAPPTWTNFDASPSLRLQRTPLLGRMGPALGLPDFPKNVRYGDIIAGLPVPAGSCRGVYCSHVLEHLSLVDLRTALLNTARILRPGGVFRAVLPDLEQVARSYTASDAPDAAIQFMKTTLLGEERRPRGMRTRLQNAIGNSRHLWMWDYKSLKAELERAGFTEVRRAQFNDAVDPRFKDVEEESRWNRHLGIEANTPL